MADDDNLILGRQNDATNETTLHRASANGPGSALFVVNDNGQAIQGTGGANLPGVSGFSDSGDGVRATSTNGNGLSARSTNSVAIFAESTNGTGVLGIGHSQPGVAGNSDSNDGVRATSTNGNGLSARSTNSVAIFAESANSTGVLGIGHSQPGVSGISDSNDGVRAVGASGNGLSAFGGGNNGVAVFAQASARRTPAAGNNSIAGFFDGDVVVSRDVTIEGKLTTTGDRFIEGDLTVKGDILLMGVADCAEEFDVVGADKVEPGSVMVIDAAGSLMMSDHAYDRKVAGVISGAGDYKTGITLDKRPAQTSRLPIAMVGKVCCRVDASYGPIEHGDLLVTSPTPGHAMKATDPARAFGAVIGKALSGLERGVGLLPILVSLQ